MCTFHAFIHKKKETETDTYKQTKQTIGCTSTVILGSSKAYENEVKTDTATAIATATTANGNDSDDDGNSDRFTESVSLLLLGISSARISTKYYERQLVCIWMARALTKCRIQNSSWS